MEVRHAKEVALPAHTLRKVAHMNNLVQETEWRRQATLPTLDPAAQAKLGQYFTPAAAAELVASIPRLPRSGTLRVLDPGAGVGSLSVALVDRVVREASNLRLHIVAVETDPGVLPALRETLAACEATGRVTSEVIEDDFIFWAAGTLDHSSSRQGPFDLVIMNPPYGKLAATALHRKAVQNAGVDCPNLYAAFLALGYMDLAEGGQVVAIIPRSFTNGPYFEPFRRHLLASIAIDRIHSFESRSTVFADTGVLQENVILGATNGGSRKTVRLTFSHGHLDDLVVRDVCYSDVVAPDDPHQFIRITTGVEQSWALGAANTLADLGLTVSTGRVVDFRARECLVPPATAESVPLIYPGNVRGGLVEWPREMRKAQGLLVRDDATRKLLMPPGYYVVIKRFSAKEERRRVVAAVWEGVGPVAFENHLNVVHRSGAGLDRDVAMGLSLWLNSTPVDDLFRTFSGHTQVNATDIRTLPFPSHDVLLALGRGRDTALPPQEELDSIVANAVGMTGQAA